MMKQKRNAQNNAISGSTGLLSQSLMASQFAPIELPSVPPNRKLLKGKPSPREQR
jgi:hypothetical protein